MPTPTPIEIRCANCGHLHATVRPAEPAGWNLEVHPPGLNIRKAFPPDTDVYLDCACGHPTPIDPAYLGDG